MTEEMLRRQVKRYENDAVRFKKHGDRCYAVYMESGDNNEFLNSQSFYKKAEEAKKICEAYKVQLRQLNK